VPDPVVLAFDEFWQWLQGHPNCILSAGTPETVLYDHEDFHWHFGREGEESLLVQVLRGKNLVGEILIPRGTVTHVSGELRGEGEFVFECFIESGEGPMPGYYFALSHEYTVEENDSNGRWVH
jgi:hypothetical protein